MANLLHPPHPDFLPPGVSAWCYDPGDDVTENLQVHTNRLRHAQRLVGLGNISIIGTNTSEALGIEFNPESTEEDAEVPAIAPSTEIQPPRQDHSSSEPERVELLPARKRGWLGDCNRPDAILTLNHQRIMSDAEAYENSPAAARWAHAIDAELHRTFRVAANKMVTSNLRYLPESTFFGTLSGASIAVAGVSGTAIAAFMYASAMMSDRDHNKKATGNSGLRDRRWSLFPAGMQPDAWLAAQALLALPGYKFVSAATSSD